MLGLATRNRRVLVTLIACSGLRTQRAARSAMTRYVSQGGVLAHSF